MFHSFEDLPPLSPTTLPTASDPLSADPFLPKKTDLPRLDEIADQARHQASMAVLRYQGLDSNMNALPTYVQTSLNNMLTIEKYVEELSRHLKKTSPGSPTYYYIRGLIDHVNGIPMTKNCWLTWGAECFVKLAEAGDPCAADGSALCHLRGIGRTPNPSEGARFLQLANPNVRTYEAILETGAKLSRTYDDQLADFDNNFSWHPKEIRTGPSPQKTLDLLWQKSSIVQLNLYPELGLRIAAAQFKLIRAFKRYYHMNQLTRRAQRCTSRFKNSSSKIFRLS